MTTHITLDGRPAARVRLVVPGTGPWHAHVSLAEGDATETPSGRVTLKIGDAALSGTVDPDHSGTFGGMQSVRVLAGGGGWRKQVPPAKHHNDAGVKAQEVAAAIASAVGETLGSFAAPARLGADYARNACDASTALEAAIAGTPWRVRFDGVTDVAAPTAFSPDPDSYEVLDYDPRERQATVVADDIRNLLPGAILSRGLATPQQVTALEVHATEDSIRAYAWMRGAGGAVTEALAAIARHVAGAKLWGHYRYRVVQMVGDRVTLQPVNSSDGVPELVAIPMRSAPGIHATLAPSSHVLVVFEAGDRQRPCIVGFSGKGDPAFVPMLIEIGGSGGSPIAYQGGTVQVVLPPAVFNGTVGGSPATGVLLFTTGTTQGTIVSGSSKAKVAL